MTTYEALRVEDLDPIAEHLLQTYPDGVVVLLQGNLGAGKSTFVERFTRIKSPESATASPTFSIMHDYGNGVYHYDIYRIGSEEFVSRGLFEELEKPGFHFVEWSDERIESLLASAEIPYVRIAITLEETKRIIHVHP